MLLSTKWKASRNRPRPIPAPPSSKKFRPPILRQPKTLPRILRQMERLKYR